MVAAAVAAVVMLALSPGRLSAQTTTPVAAPALSFSGYVPRDGVSLVTLDAAGSPADIVAALSPLGCDAQMLALTLRGAFTSYAPAAPEFANSGFPTYVSTGTALAIRCQATATTTVTNVVHFVPSEAAAGSAQDGRCWTSSLALSGRTDAWRCMTGNVIHDPCIQLADGAIVCDANPSTGAGGFLVTLTEPLPAPQVTADGVANAAKNGWLVELDDGMVCGMNTGATGGVNGERANYGCPDGQWIFGDLIPGDAGTPWTAVLGTLKVGADGYSLGSARQAIVKTVWQ